MLVGTVVDSGHFDVPCSDSSGITEVSASNVGLEGGEVQCVCMSKGQEKESNMTYDVLDVYEQVAS